MRQWIGRMTAASITAAERGHRDNGWTSLVQSQVWLAGLIGVIYLFWGLHMNWRLGVAVKKGDEKYTETEPDRTSFDVLASDIYFTCNRVAMGELAWEISHNFAG